jgi:predicted helicase
MNTKGSLFEDFAEALFVAVNGFTIRYKRAKAKASKTEPEHDYDLIIQNISKVFTEFGNYILVECKGWKEPVGYPEIAKFLHKLHSRKCSTGIIIALGGVVYSEFNPTLKRTFDQDGIAVLVIDKKDINKVINFSVNLASLLRKKYEQVRFGLI